jgi:hypothetical protein
MQQQQEMQLHQMQQLQMLQSMQMQQQQQQQQQMPVAGGSAGFEVQMVNVPDGWVGASTGCR